MTEKRLYDVIDKAEPRGQSVTYDGIPCTARTCVTRLNRLTEENEELRIKNNAFIQDVEVYKEENSHLKLENDHLKNHIEELQKHCKRLENDNIRTYTLIKEAYNNERTEMGRMILRQLLEDVK